mgnify:CR=1 FL=1
MMIDTPCARSQCPEMPKVSLDQAVVDLMESIALQETALSTFCVPKAGRCRKPWIWTVWIFASCWK